MAYRMSKLEAVNRIVISLKGRRFSALDSSGSWPSLTYTASQCSEIEFELDQVLREIASRGEHEGTLMKYQLITGEGSNQINFATTGTNKYANCIRAVPSGKDEGRRWTMVDGKAYSLEDASNSVFTNGSTFQWDVYVVNEFSQCSTELQQAVLAEATVRLQRRFGGDGEMDKFYAQERDMAAATAQKPNTQGVKNQVEGKTIFMSSPQGQQGQ